MVTVFESVLLSVWVYLTVYSNSDTFSTLNSQPSVLAVNVCPQMVISPFRLTALLIFSVKSSPV